MALFKVQQDVLTQIQAKPDCDKAQLAKDLGIAEHYVNKCLFTLNRDGYVSSRIDGLGKTIWTKLP